MDSEQPGETQGMCRRRPERHGVSVKENVPARGRPPGLAKTCSGHVPEDMPQGCGAVPVGIPHTTCYSILVNCESPVLRLQFGRKSKGKRPCTARACPADTSCPMTFFACPWQGSAPRLCSRISGFSLAAHTLSSPAAGSRGSAKAGTHHGERHRVKKAFAMALLADGKNFFTEL